MQTKQPTILAGRNGRWAIFAEPKESDSDQVCDCLCVSYLDYFRMKEDMVHLLHLEQNLNKYVKN